MLRAEVAPADRPLSVEGELEDAKAATGLSDWGPDQSFRIGLGVLLEAAEEMNPPVPFRTMVKGRVQHLLRQRLHMRDDEVRHPEIITDDIKDIFVVTGLPRSGTTVTYDLLTSDPRTRAPREWEINTPWPAPEAATFDTDPRIAALNHTYEHILEVAPDFANVQRLDASQAGECNTTMMLHFAGTNFWAELSVPKHTQWTTTQSVEGLYPLHKRVLQQLQWKGPRGRWTVKSPNHMFDLPGLIATYPGAKILWTHRDPVKTMSSLSSMVVMLQTAFGAPVNPKKIGEDITEIWCRALLRGVEARKDSSIEARVVDVPHRDVTQRPAEAMRRVSEHFGLPFGEADAARINAFMKDHPSAKRFGAHKHEPATFGIDGEKVRARLQPYYDRFGDLLSY